MIYSTGTISFQANDSSDVFCKMELKMEGLDESDETLIGVEDPHFETGNQGWVMGNVPKIKPVHVPGDTTIIHAWFQQALVDHVVLRIYVEYEEAEELVEVEEEHSTEIQEGNRDLESNEIHL